MVEGEKVARAVQRAGYTAAIWPDNDAPGKQAAHKAAEAGASVVWLLDPVDGAKADAADIPEEELAE